MPIGLLNPADVTHSTTVKPAYIPSGVNQRRYYSDDLSTSITQQDFIQIVEQVRYCLDAYGISDLEGDDTALKKAIDAGASALHGNLLLFQSLVGSPDKVPFFTGGSSMDMMTATSFSRGLLAKTNPAQWRDALGITSAGSGNVVAFGNLASAPDLLPYFTGVETMGMCAFKSWGRGLVGQNDVLTARTYLGLGSAAIRDETYFATMATLASYAPLASPIFTGNPIAPTQSQVDNSTKLATTAYVKAAFTAYGGTLATIAVSGSASDLIAGTVPAARLPSSLSTIYALTPAADRFPYYPNSASAALTPLTAFARTFLDDIDAPTARGTLLLGTAAVRDETFFAPIVSPALTGSPTAPTPSAADNSTRISTTAFVATALLAYALLASPAFSGTPTAPTPATLDSTTKIATTAYVKANIAALTTADIGGLSAALALKADLASPALTGTPTAPTQTVGNNSTRLATTAFVTTAFGSKADLDSPAFTGVPTAPTAIGGTNTAQLATTAFVSSAVAVAMGGGSLASLIDVTISSPANGQFLKYNSATSKWINDPGVIATATGERLTLSDTTLIYGAAAVNFVIQNRAPSASVIFSGGSTSALGGNAIFYGETNASFPGRGILRSAAINMLRWDPTLNLDSLVAHGFIDGALAGPGIAFTSDLNTGIRRIGADNWSLVTGGADSLTFNTTDATFAVPVTSNLGFNSTRTALPGVYLTGNTLSVPAYFYSLGQRTALNNSAAFAGGILLARFQSGTAIQANVLGKVVFGGADDSADINSVKGTASILAYASGGTPWAVGSTPTGLRFCVGTVAKSMTDSTGANYGDVIAAEVPHTGIWDFKFGPTVNGVAILTISGGAITGNVSAAQLTANAGVVMVDRTGDATAAQMLMRGDVGQNRELLYQTGTSNRWNFRVNSAAEGGSNAGSDFNLNAYDDSGVSLGTVFIITRATRTLAFSISPTAPTPATADNSTTLATTGYVKANLASYALLASPALTGTPTAPTPTTADSTTKLSTTAYVQANLAFYAPLTSPGFGGTPTAPTAATADNSTTIATTAHVKANLASYATIASLSVYALLASPAFTGVPTAPIATLGTNTNQLAATAFVQTALSAGLASYMPLTGGTFTGIVTFSAGNPLIDRTGSGANTSLTLNGDIGSIRLISAQSGGLARWQLRLADSTAEAGANAGSNMSLQAYSDDGTLNGSVYSINRASRIVNFTLSPTAPTPATADNSTSLATTAYVKSNIGALTTVDIGGLVAALALKADLASPALTGNPTAPTQSPGNNSTRLATTAFAVALMATATLSGLSDTAISAPADGQHLKYDVASSKWINGIGINDLSTGLRLILGDDTLQVGAAGGSLDYSIVRRQDSTILYVSGGTTNSTGANILLRGPTQASPSRGILRCDGTTYFRWDPTLGLDSLFQHGFIDGILAAPGITFTSDPDNGLRRIGANNWSLVAGAADIAILTTTGINFPLAASFTASPTAPTPATADNSTLLATTAYVKAQLYATLAGPAFTGAPTAPTQVAGNNTTRLATTAFVTAAVSTAVGPLAPLASPAFTGTPTSTTSTTGDNSTRIATTAYVQNNLAAYAPLTNPIFNGNVTVSGIGSTQFTISGDASAFRSIVGQTVGVTRWAFRLGDALAESGGTSGGVGSQCTLVAYDNSGGLIGNVWIIPRNTRIVDFQVSPTAPTPATADNSFSLSTTAYVKANLISYAPLVAPVFTGGSVTVDRTADTQNALFTVNSLSGQYRGLSAQTNGVARWQFRLADSVAETGANAGSNCLLTAYDDTGALLGSVYVVNRATRIMDFTVSPTGPTPATADSTIKLATTAYVQANLASYAPLASPALTGNPTAVTQGAGNNSTRLATTAYVQGELASYAPLASPTLTGTPAAPTAAAATNTTQIATTAYVKSQSYATLASPTFTGTPSAPTPVKASNGVAIATTAFVQTNLADYATLISPALTGTPTAPTAADRDASTKIATTAYVDGADNHYSAVTNTNTTPAVMTTTWFGALVRLNMATAMTCALPDDATLAVPTGTWIDFVQWGAGQTTFSAGGTTSLFSQPTIAGVAVGLKTIRYGIIRAVKIAANTWMLSGAGLTA